MDSVVVRELQEELSRLNSLKAHVGYGYLIGIAEAQIESRKQQIILTPLSSMDAVLKQEYAKGEVAGIDLFRWIVDIRIRDLEEEIQERLKDNERNTE